LGIANSNAKEKAAKENTEKATRKGKRKGTNSNEFRIPKMGKVEKSCTLCQKHGCAHMTHIPVSAVSTRRMELLRTVSARKQPLDKNAMVMVRKTMLIPLRISWNTSRNSRKLSKRPRKACERRNVAKNTATLVILTRIRIRGTVVL
jgi:hypothetical protein